MKRLLFILLLTGSIGMAFADNVTCFLPSDKRTVTALPDEQLTLGVPDPNNGRTVCYRWSSDDCSSCFTSSTDQPTVSVRMPSEIGTYHFTVKKISDHVQTCDVIVIVESDLEIVSVTPKYECYSEGDVISEDHFIIVTDPPGLERNVKLANDSRQAHCIGATHHTCEQPLTFVAKVDDRVLDNKIINITVYTSELVSVEIPADIKKMAENIRKTGEVLRYIYSLNNKMSSLFSSVDFVNPIRFELEPWDSDVTIGAAFGICCDGKAGQTEGSLSFSVSTGAKWYFYYPVVAIPIPFLKKWFPSIYLEGQIGISFGAAASLSINTCADLSLDVPVDITAHFSGGVSYGQVGDNVYLSASVFGEPNINGTWHVLPPSNFGVECHGNMKIGVDLTYQIWRMKNPKTKRFTVWTIQMW